MADHTRKEEASRWNWVLPRSLLVMATTHRDAPCWCCCSHIKRIVLATKETTVTHQVNHRPIKCQSRLWSQRGTKVNGSHCGDNPLLRLTGIQIATKRYATLQAMAPTNIKTFHQTHIHTYREQPRSTRIIFVAYPQPAFSATKRTNYAPTSFHEQVQVSQGHISYKNKEK